MENEHRRYSCGEDVDEEMNSRLESGYTVPVGIDRDRIPLRYGQRILLQKTS
jgi:hypothetical protein